jgi:hypothetical protein
VTPFTCSRCGEPQIAFGTAVPADRVCHACRDAERALNVFTEADAGVPARYRKLTRAGWEAHFQTTWPAALENWTGNPHWVALWGPTGTGKTGLATVLLAEHLRKGNQGYWISGPELSRRIQRDFANVEDVIAPLLLVTSLLILDEPLAGAAADWYTERIVLITRSRDDWGLPTVVTSQLLPELLKAPTAAAPPPVLSRWLSGIQLCSEHEDIRLKGRH